MILHRAFRYRLRPTPEQEATLLRWEGALRFLWNLGLEQYLLWIHGCVPRGKGHLPCSKREHPQYPSAFGQSRQLTDLRKDHPWIADVPRNICDSIFASLGEAWKRCWKSGFGRPHWKRRGDPMGMIEGHGEMFDLIMGTGATKLGILDFPKIGKIHAVTDRPLGSKPKRCTITRDGNEWYASILCEVEVADPVPSTKPGVGIDRGVVLLLADSTGRTVADPGHLQKAQRRLTRAQRQLSKKQKGSQNRKKAAAKVGKIHRQIRRQREWALHQESKHYAKNHGLIVLERLQIGNMTASAKGTIEEPGKRVRQKAGLNRSILSMGWGIFATQLKYKVIVEGGEVREVAAAYTSCTCSKCGHVAVESRVSQSVFRCVACGHEENADTNAAKNIYSRGAHGSAVCGGSGVTRPTKQKGKIARSAKRLSREPMQPESTNGVHPKEPSGTTSDSQENKAVAESSTEER